jgi:hypothetical protein
MHYLAESRAEDETICGEIFLAVAGKLVPHLPRQTPKTSWLKHQPAVAALDQSSSRHSLKTARRLQAPSQLSIRRIRQ